jgi:putative transposase
VEHVTARLDVSERFVCRVLGQHRSTQRKVSKRADDEAALTASIIELARQFGRYGYRRITALLRTEGWHTNHKRVERIWRAEGLKVPQRQPKRGRLWLNDGSCVRLRPDRPNHVWAYDFVEDRTRDGRKFRTLNVVDEFTREALAIRVARQLKAVDVIVCAGGPVHHAWHPGTHPVGQRAGVCGDRGEGLDHGRGCQDRIHRTRQSVG